MSLQPFRTLTARTLVLPQENIDTDQIVPARFLTTTSREGLGAAAFRDWRFDADGRALATSPLPEPDAGDRRILVAGANFGCGSSREHAPWALLDYGVRAVVSTDIADIFRNNALKNGLLPVEVGPAFHAQLLAAPGAEATIDLEANQIRLGDAVETFLVEPFARRCLLEGVDTLGFLLAQEDAIAAFERARG